MNILIFTTAFYPSIGGLESQTLNLMAEFIKCGHNVKVITMPFKSVRVAFNRFNLKGVEVYYRPSFLKRLELILWCNVLYMPNISLKGYWFLLILYFKRWIISHNDDYLNKKKILKPG